jgi:hypothetical protein
MHKDCIILIQKTLGSQVKVTTENLHQLLLHLRQFHICKIIYFVHEADNAMQEWLLTERRTYGFAIDIEYCTHDDAITNEDMAKLLLHGDSGDVIVLNGNCTAMPDIDKLLATQQSQESDITLLTNRASTTFAADLYEGAMVVFKPSFASLNLDLNLSFEDSYLKCAAQHQHNLQCLVEARVN